MSYFCAEVNAGSFTLISVGMFVLSSPFAVHDGGVDVSEDEAIAYYKDDTRFLNANLCILQNMFDQNTKHGSLNHVQVVHNLQCSHDQLQ